MSLITPNDTAPDVPCVADDRCVQQELGGAVPGLTALTWVGGRGSTVYVLGVPPGWRHPSSYAEGAVHVAEDVGTSNKKGEVGGFIGDLWENNARRGGLHTH